MRTASTNAVVSLFRRLTVAVAICVLPVMAAWSQADNDDTIAKGELVEFKADYELRRNSIRAAKLTRTLSCENGVCEYRSQGRTVGFADLLFRGSINEWSRFYLEDGKIVPRDYYYSMRARGTDNDYRRLFFNPQTGRVSSRGDERWEAEVDGEAMDQLLSQLRLMLAVSAGETEMAFTVVDDDGSLDEYRFITKGVESVETGAGTFEAIRVEHVEDERKRRHTTMWFAPDLGFIPVIVKQERRDRETYTATLTRVHKDP